MRVGRSALDEDAIRLIEQHNPGVEFDWTRILKGQDAPSEPIPQPERRPRPRTREFPAPRPVVPAAPLAAPVEAETAHDPGRMVEHEGPRELEAPEDPGLETGEPPPEPVDGPASDAQPGAPLTPAQARLGFEGLSRLRARHAEVLARISEKVMDAAARDQLKSAAERLNPDTWVTDDEVTAGLESYESVFESLRGVVGRGRKRRGRPPGAPGQASAAPGTTTPPTGPDAPDGPGEDL